MRSDASRVLRAVDAPSVEGALKVHLSRQRRLGGARVSQVSERAAAHGVARDTPARTWTSKPV